MQGLVPTRAEFEQAIPEQYRNYAGIGPYYLPVFGRMYSSRLQDLIDTVTRWVVRPETLLDAGCGFGLATSRLAEIYPTTRIYGLDLYAQSILDVAKNLRPASQRVEFISGSIEEAPFEDHAFDAVTAFDSLEHVPHPEIALKEIVRLLKPDGVAIVSVPIESPVLGALRYVALAGGRLGEINPHWGGTFSSLNEFEAEWLRLFVPLDSFNTPLRFAPRMFNYDVVYVGRPRM